MSRLYRIIIQVCWAGGFISLLIGVAFKLHVEWAILTHTTSRAGLVMAGVLFLAVLATQAMERVQASGS